MEPWRRNLWVIWFSNFATLCGVAGVVPFLPSIVRATGVTDEGELRVLSGAVYAAAFLSAAIMGPVWGVLGDRYGRKVMVMRSLLAISLFMSLQSLVTSPWVFLVLRLLHGAFSGFVAPALTLVSTSAPPERQGYVTSVLQTSLVGGAFAGPLLGGFVADRWGYPCSFLVSGALAAAAFLAVLLFAREAREKAAAPTAPARGPAAAAATVAARLRGDLAALLSPGPLRRLVFLVLLVQFGLASTEPLMALYVHGLDPAAENIVVGLVFATAALANLLLAPWWGLRSDRRGFRGTLTFTLAGAALVYFPQALVSQPSHLLPFRLALGACLAGVLPSAYALVGRLTPLSLRGGSFGLTLSAFQVGNVLGPLFGGFVAAKFGLHAVFFITSAVLLAASYAAHRIVPEPAAARAHAGGGVASP